MTLIIKIWAEWIQYIVIYMILSSECDSAIYGVPINFWYIYKRVPALVARYNACHWWYWTGHSQCPHDEVVMVVAVVWVRPDLPRLVLGRRPSHHRPSLVTFNHPLTSHPAVCFLMPCWLTIYFRHSFTYLSRADRSFPNIFQLQSENQLYWQFQVGKWKYQSLEV